MAIGGGRQVIVWDIQSREILGAYQDCILGYMQMTCAFDASLLAIGGLRVVDTGKVFAKEAADDTLDCNVLMLDLYGGNWALRLDEMVLEQLGLERDVR